MSNLIECKVCQPNVRLKGKLKKVGEIVEVSKDIAAFFRLALVPIKKAQVQKNHKKSFKNKSKDGGKDI